MLGLRDLGVAVGNLKFQSRRHHQGAYPRIGPFLWMKMYWTPLRHRGRNYSRQGFGRSQIVKDALQKVVKGTCRLGLEISPLKKGISDSKIRTYLETPYPYGFSESRSLERILGMRSSSPKIRDKHFERGFTGWHGNLPLQGPNHEILRVPTQIITSIIRGFWREYVPPGANI